MSKSNFAGLIDDLAEVETLTKAFADKPEGETAQDDAAIEAAEAEGEGEGEGEKKPEGEADEAKPLAKSFTMTLDDGSTVEAIDGAEMIKSLIARVEAGEASQGEVLTKAVAAVVGLGAMVKSLQDQVEALQNSGRPRKAVLSVSEKPAATADILAKSDQPAGVSGEEFLAKALAANAQGRITSLDVAICENHINAGQEPPANLVRAVLTA